jgi:hypothetical protein
VLGSGSHRGETGRSGASQEPEQHRLGLVIGGVPGHCAGWERITTCLAGPSFEIRPRGDRHFMEFEGDSE